MGNKKALMLLSLIILLGFFLRIYDIGEESFWIDEGSTALTVTKYNGLEILKNIYEQGQILPGYYPAVSDLPMYHYTIELWSLAFGISEVSLRAYSALFGLLAIIYVYLIAKLIFNKKVGLLASFLLAISIPAIEFSQEARPYSLFLFLATASSYYFLKALENNRKRDWIWYAVFILIGLYTHYLFELMLLSHILYMIFDLFFTRKYKFKNILDNIKNKGILKSIFVVYLIISIISSPLILRTFRTDNVEPWWSRPTISNTAKIFVNFATWFYPSQEGKDKISSGSILDIGTFDFIVLSSALLTALLFYFFIGSYLYKNVKNIMKEKYVVFLLVWFLFPLCLALFVSILTPVAMFTSFRYFLFCLPPFVIIASKGILSFKKKVFGYFLVALIILNALPLYAYYKNVNNQQWRELADYIKANGKANEPIVISISYGEVTFRYYYADARVKGVQNADDAKEFIKGDESLWLVLTFWQYYDPEGSIQRYFEENYKLIETKEFYDLELRHYKK